MRRNKEYEHKVADWNDRLVLVREVKKEADNEGEYEGWGRYMNCLDDEHARFVVQELEAKKQRNKKGKG